MRRPGVARAPGGSSARVRGWCRRRLDRRPGLAGSLRLEGSADRVAFGAPESIKRPDLVSLGRNLETD